MDISDRPVRFEIWIPKSPKITPEVHNELSKNAHACLFVFTRNSQESWDMITTVSFLLYLFIYSFLNISVPFFVV